LKLFSVAGSLTIWRPKAFIPASMPLKQSSALCLMSYKFRRHLFPHRRSLKYQRITRYLFPSFFQVFQPSDMIEFLPDDSLGLPDSIFIFRPNGNSENVSGIPYPPLLEIGILIDICMPLFVSYAGGKADSFRFLLKADFSAPRYLHLHHHHRSET
jgi:hypothetical protein